VIMENPTYPGAVAIFHGARARCLSVPMNTHAEPEKPLGWIWRPSRLPWRQIASNSFCLRRTFQNPRERRCRWLRGANYSSWPGGTRFPWWKDHIYARLHAREERIPSLKQLDRSNLVIHIDSFAKVAFPGLRVGWIVAPPTAIERLRVVKQTTDLHTDQLAQATLPNFCGAGFSASIW